jgi:hypothetical protein
MLDQVNRQISFTTASINEPPRARGQFITVSHYSQHFHLADFFRHELERDNRSKNKYSTRTTKQATFYLAQRKKYLLMVEIVQYADPCEFLYGDPRKSLPAIACVSRLFQKVYLDQYSRFDFGTGFGSKTGKSLMPLGSSTLYSGTLPAP